MGGTLYTGYAGADTGFPEGGGETFTSTHPLGHCLRDVIKLKNAPLDIHKHPPLDPRDVIRPPKNGHPHTWTFTSTPLRHYPCDVIHIPRGGGGDRSRSRTLCIGFQYWDKFKGGMFIPVTPPPGSATGMVGLSMSSSNRRGWLISHSGAYFHL